MNAKIPIIIDTDPGIDDMIALLFALASPELEILAYVASFGNADAQSTYINILKLYQALSKHFDAHPEDKARFPNFDASPKPILARGSEVPLGGPVHTAFYFHGRDGLGDITERHPDLNVPLEEHGATSHPQLRITDQTGPAVVLDLVKSRPSRSVTYLALGPLTTLAQVMLAGGELIRDRIGRVVCLGGALDVPGNTTPVAEFNFFADPYAVKQLLCCSPSLGLPLDRFVLLPLDVSTPHQLEFSRYKAQVDPMFESTSSPSQSACKSPLVHFTSSFLERTREKMLEFGTDAMELHDIVAVWCAIHNPPRLTVGSDLHLNHGWEAVKRHFDIERTGEITRGMLVVDRRGDQGAYAPGANRAEVQTQLERLHGSHKGHWESTAVPALVEVQRPVARAADPDRGVWCVRETPGPEVLLQFLLSRVWGVEIR